MPQQHHRRVEGELPLPFGHAVIVHNVWQEPIDIIGSSSLHHLELALLPQPVRGRGCFSDAWRSDRFEPIGDVFLLPAHHRVRAISECRRQQSIIFEFDPSSVDHWFEQSLEWTDARLRHALNIANPRVRDLLTALGDEIRAPGFASEAMAELLAAQAVIEVSRHLLGVREEQADGGLAAWRLRIIDERLEDLASAPTLAELAGLCQLSVRHLARAFRVSRGCSLGRYIADHRLRQARRLLASGTSIKVVAYSTGFSSPSNFTAAFRRATGETPRSYRQRAARTASGKTSLH